VGGSKEASGPAAMRDAFDWDEALSVTLQLRVFLAEYHASYVTERSLVAQVCASRVCVVCVCARARAHARACMRACVCGNI